MATAVSDDEVVLSGSTRPPREGERLFASVCDVTMPVLTDGSFSTDLPRGKRCSLQILRLEADHSMIPGPVVWVLPGSDEPEIEVVLTAPE